MQFMQLEMFVAVCEEKSFSRAAESLSWTNAAVTLAIVKLEKEVGTRLLARSRRAVHHPTKAGELVYEYASQILGLRDDLRFAFDGAQTGHTKRFRIGISTSIKWMSPLVESFRRKYPQVRMEICYGPPDALCQEVQGAKIDFAIVPTEISLADLGSSLMLIPVSCPSSSREPSVFSWLVERRVVWSHTGRMFEEEIIAFITDKKKLSKSVKQ